jgi:hypothetical protein
MTVGLGEPPSPSFLCCILGERDVALKGESHSSGVLLLSKLMFRKLSSDMLLLCSKLENLCLN